MDLKTYEIKLCSEWQKEFEKKYGVFTQSNIHSDLCVTGHSFWILLKEKNYVMEYNMLDDTYSFYQIGERENQYSCKETVISFTEKEKQKLLKKKIEMQMLIQEKGCLDLKLSENRLLPEDKKDQVLHKKDLVGNEIYRITANKGFWRKM